MFDRVKRLFNRSPTEGIGIRMINMNDAGYLTWNGKLYKSDIIRACLRPRAKAIGKAEPQHIRKDANETVINPEPYMRFIMEEPNAYMSWQLLAEKVDNQLQLNNNAFIMIDRNEDGVPIGLYPVNASFVQLVKDKYGNMYYRFHMMKGEIYTISMNDVVHLRDDFISNDIFGESPIEALRPVMEVINTTDQGIVKAIKNSGIIKWLLKFKTTVRPEDMKKQTQDFVKNYMDIENDSVGAAASDTKYDVQQVEPKDYVPNAAQMDRSIRRVYAFFNTNEKIVMSQYNEDEWNAYYEAVIEPRIIQLAQCLTLKLFNRRERAFGNRIAIKTSNLQYASMSTKLSLMQMVDRGAMTPNEWRDTLGMPPIPGGDKPIRRLDTAPVTTEGGEDK